MNIWTTIRNWVVAWFLDRRILKVIDVLESVNDLIDKAIDVVKDIDEDLKPKLKVISSDGGDSVDIYETVLIYLEKFKEQLGDIVAIAQKVYLLPLPDMLFTIAIEILKSQAIANPSISILRLAVELGYNIYKRSKKS